MASNSTGTVGKIALSVAAVGMIGIVTLALVAGIMLNCTGILFTPDTCGPGDNFLALLVVAGGISTATFVLWLIWRSPNAPERQTWTDRQASRHTEHESLRYPL